MADQQRRAELEAAQAEVEQLRREIDAFPAVSAERFRLQRDREALRLELERLAEEERSLRGVAMAAHDSAGQRREPSPRGAWWQSLYTLPAAALGAYAAFEFAARAPAFIDWSFFAPRAGPVLVGLVAVVHAVRWAAARRRNQNVTVQEPVTSEKPNSGM